MLSITSSNATSSRPSLCHQLLVDTIRHLEYHQVRVLVILDCFAHTRTPEPHYLLIQASPPRVSSL